MPDRFDFDQLGPEVRCIWCQAGGSRHEWPETRRAQHHCDHGQHDREQTVSARRREADARRDRRHSTPWWTSTHSPRICANPYCSQLFTPARITRMFCSDRCRKATSRLPGDR